MFVRIIYSREIHYSGVRVSRVNYFNVQRTRVLDPPKLRVPKLQIKTSRDNLHLAEISSARERERALPLQVIASN